MHTSPRAALLTLVVAALLYSAAFAVCPPADLDGDCEVTSRDLQIFAQQWLVAPAGSADFNGDLRVNSSDFVVLGRGWHKANLPLVINEFMAANNGTVQDPQGDFDDWIEIHNLGDEDIDMGGMYLTDDPEDPAMWQIPKNKGGLTVVPAGGYLLIWADTHTEDLGLHAAFRLDAEGEQIALFDVDGATLIDSVEFSDQAADISFGRYPNGGDTWRFMGVPTAGWENAGIYNGFVDDVKFSHDSGFYDMLFWVTLATETDGAVVYYTTDGSEPYQLSGRQPKGTIYTEPILVPQTTRLRAKAIKPGWKPSDVETRGYIFLDSNVRGFTSNLPIAVVDTFGGYISRGEPTFAITGIADVGEDGRAHIRGEPQFMGRSGINIRGQSSGGFPKHQYHFEVWDEYDQDADASLLALPAESDWVLQGPYSDKSLIRNYLSYMWSNDMGQYAPRCRLIEMFLHTGSGNISYSDYVGVYVLMEKIKRDENRVDIAELKPTHNSEPQVTGGYIFKKDKPDIGVADPTFTTSTGQVLRYEDPDGLELTQMQKNWLTAYINSFEAALYSPDFNDPVIGYQNYIDPASFFDIHILVELTKNIDGFRLSTYMYKDRGGKIHMGPAWDYNLSLGNADYLQGWTPVGWYFSQLGNDAYPWWRRLFQDLEFRLGYADRWFSLREDILSTNRLLGIVDETATVLNESQQRNFNRWRILGTYIWPNWYIASTYQQEIAWMKGWIRDRLEWMDGQIAQEWGAHPPVFSLDGGAVPSGLSVDMNASRGDIYFTTDGSDPRVPPDGGLDERALAAEDAVKRVLVPKGPIAENWKGGGAFDDSEWMSFSGEPGGVGYEITPGDPVNYAGLIGLDLESLMYDNRGNPGANTTCYIRIPFHFDGQPWPLDFLNLKIRYDSAFIAYLNGVEIARDNFAGVPSWKSRADVDRPDSEAVRLRTFDVMKNMNALRPGDNVLAIHGMNSATHSHDFLVSVQFTGGERLPSYAGVSDKALKYARPLPVSKSTHIKARSLDGSTWSALNEAVFAIGPVAESLRINEIMYHPLDSADPNDPNDPNEEYIELVNTGSGTINLSLVRFTNAIDFTFGDVELLPGEYTLVVEDVNAFEARYGQGLPIAGQYNGRFANNGEKVELVDAIGNVIHSFSYSDNWRHITDNEGYSLTIIDPANPDPNSWDRKDSWRPSAFRGGSPGADDSGILPLPGAIVFDEILAHSHDEASDWIELYNTTGGPIHIGGWYLSDSASNIRKYRIPVGTILGPGRRKVFHETTHFGASSVDPGRLEPFALSENGETAYLSSATAGELTGYRETQDFGASSTGVSFGRYFKGSTGNYNFVPISYPTPGLPNAYPKVGPIIISEINYNPTWPLDGGSYTNDQYEYIEIRNVSAVPITLYRQDKGEPWKITDGVDFTFPAAPGAATIGPGDYLIIAKKPEAFIWRYPRIPSPKIFGPYDGSLSDSGERIELSSPGDLDNSGVRQYIREDRVVYSDGSHPQDQPGGIDLWPTEADGQGLSLHRIDFDLYGNDPNNWQAAEPSPGQ